MNVDKINVNKLMPTEKVLMELDLFGPIIMLNGDGIHSLQNQLRGFHKFGFDHVFILWLEYSGYITLRDRVVDGYLTGNKIMYITQSGKEEVERIWLRLTLMQE